MSRFLSGLLPGYAACPGAALGIVGAVAQERVEVVEALIYIIEVLR